MRFRRILALVGLLISSASAFAADDYVHDEVLVKYRPAYAALSSVVVPMRLHATVKRSLSEIGWYTLKLPPGETPQQAIGTLSKLPDVEKVELNHYVHATFTPTDPDYPLQYGPKKIGCEAGWDLTLGVSSVTIAVVDTGTSLSHPEFSGRLVVLAGSNIVAGNGNPDDDNGHGTHCSGIAAAGIDNGIGIAGVCPGAKIMPVKVLDASGSGTDDQVAQGFLFAANNGANIISASLGGPGQSSVLQDACNTVISQGKILCCAAGNDGSSTQFYPAAYDGVVSVGATDSNDKKADFSNFGDWVLVAAPGVDILSTLPNNTYGKDSGTSMACPHVAGAFGLLLSFSPGSTRQNLLNAIYSTTDNVGTWLHYGRINVANALGTLSPPATSTLSPSDAAPYEGTYASGSASDLTALDGVSYNVNSVGPVAGIQVASAVTHFLLTVTTDKISRASITVSASGGDRGTNMIYVFNWLKNRYEPIKQFPMSNSSSTTVDITPGLTKYVRSGTIQVLVRGYVNGRTTGGTAVPFTYAIDQANVGLTMKNGV